MHPESATLRASDSLCLREMKITWRYRRGPTQQTPWLRDRIIPRRRQATRGRRCWWSPWKAWRSVLPVSARQSMQLSYRRPEWWHGYVLLREGVDQLRKHMVLHHSLSQLFRMVGDSSQCQSCWILDGDRGIEQKWSQLFEDAELMQVVDVLGFGGEVCQLLGKFYLSLLELFEGWLKRLHR